MNKCECGIAKSLTGDGCRYCQPQTYIDKLSGIIEDMEKEAEAKSALRNGSTGDEVEEQGGQQDGEGLYYDLTVQLLNLRNEIFSGAQMDKDTFTKTYLNGLGEYEREVARKEKIDIGW